MSSVNLPPRNGGKVSIRQGGNAPKKPSGTQSERHTRAQDPLYEEWVTSQATLELIFTDGSAWSGKLQTYDTYGLRMIGNDQRVALIFKQGIRSIRPID